MANDTLIDKIKLKLEEYGFEIYDEYQEDDSHIFLVNQMALFLKDDNSLVVSFEVVTQPDDAAVNILILKEIEELTEIRISDCFIFDSKGTIVCGKEAFDLVEKSKAKKAVNEYVQEKEFEEIFKHPELFIKV